jgi:hypothetical protein
MTTTIALIGGALLYVPIATFFVRSTRFAD